MSFLYSKLKDNSFVFLVFFGFAYLYGLLSTEHFLMFGNSFYLGLLVTALFGVATYFGLKTIEIKKLGFSTLTWLGLAAIVAIQPLFNHIAYPDALIFPFGLFLLSAIFSLIAVNLPAEKKLSMTDYFAWLLLIVGLLSAGTQFIQLFFPNTFGFIAPISPLGRPYSNIAQPNHASFVNVLAITAGFCLYYRYCSNKINTKYLVFFIISFLILAIGISLTSSRAGLILLAVSIFGVLFYTWSSQKLRFSLFVASIALAVASYQLGVWLLTNVFSLYQGNSGVERLLSDGVGLRRVLWDRAWSAFSANPIFGVGYDNYLSHGLQNIETLAWFEPADNSHHIISHIAAEFGLLGLFAMLGAVVVIIRQIILFFKKKLLAQELFLCIVLALFVLFSFSEFPLWYPVLLFPFVFFLGLLDKGFELKTISVKKPIMAMTIVLALLSALYTGLYRSNLINYETVVFSNASNQQKIDAYQAFPNVFGFAKSKEYMLFYIVDDSNPDNIERLIEMGDRLMTTGVVGMEIAEVQAILLMKAGKQDEADTINRRLCVWEYQHVKQCNKVVEQILALDADDEMGYAKRLSKWYNEWLLTRK